MKQFAVPSWSRRQVSEILPRSLHFIRKEVAALPAVPFTSFALRLIEQKGGIQLRVSAISPVIHLFQRCGRHLLAGRIGVSYRFAGHGLIIRSVTLSGKGLCLFLPLSQNSLENLPGRLKQDVRTSIF
jgi:hypothetical protein